MICPACTKENYCKYTPLSKSCSYTKMLLVFDNPVGVAFAIAMSVWATIFREFWKRRQAVLQMKWNVVSVDDDVSLRAEFCERAKHTKISPITGNNEPYDLKRRKCWSYTVTSVVCLFMIIIVLFAVLSVIIYRIMITALIQSSGPTALTSNVTFITMTTGSIICVIFIKIFGKFYGKVSMWLTRKENPRTQVEFDNSYTYKRYLLSFVNNYAAVSYIAFVKGRLFTYPGDASLTLLHLDICHPTGCLMGLCIQLAFIMLLKTLVGNLLNLVIPVIRNSFKKRPDVQVLQQWEEDYTLIQADRYFLIGEYMEMVLQYGFATFFVAAFPLAPLCALLNNILETRLDAHKLVRNYRRPVPIRVSGIGAWNGILQAVTYLGVVTNAFVIAFTTNFIEREIYKYQVDYSLKGFMMSILSSFSTKDYKSQSDTMLAQNVSICYYRGKRYPPDSPYKYQLSHQYWNEIAIKFIFIIVFEHVIMVLTGILAYAIPDVPFSVRTQMIHEQNQQKELYYKNTPNLYKLQQKDKSNINHKFRLPHHDERLATA